MRTERVWNKHPHFTVMVVFADGFNISIFSSEKLHILALDGNRVSKPYELYLVCIY